MFFFFKFLLAYFSGANDCQLAQAELAPGHVSEHMMIIIINIIYISLSIINNKIIINNIINKQFSSVS
jgi:hypothetical protein